MTIANSIDILNELTNNFLVSSLDTNMGRAFPDVRDGLKPGQRCILWEMWSKKYLSSKPHVKSAKISGGVIANWWPHSDVAIYETFARMSQSFTNNVPEIDFHGANGNIILGGDAVANQRYTEARLSPVVEEGMFKGIDKNSVDMILNFSQDAKMPTVLPAIFPRLLVNGAQGIGVSIANTWIGHNLKETGELISKYIQTGELDQDNYYPDFPTGGCIINKDDLPEINKTGKGKVILEANYKIDNLEIDFYEMPYQVYIEPVIEQIKDGIEQDKIHGIKEVLNKSDKKRISLTVACDQKKNIEQTLIELFTYTDLRKQYNVNQNGIVSKTPCLLNLQQVIDAYIKHNCTCIRREYEYDKDKSLARIHIIEGLLIAINNIDAVINIIKQEKQPSVALKEKFELDDEQVKAILDMKLARLSKLEKDKLATELREKEDLVQYCIKIISSKEEQKKILIERLDNLCQKYGSGRHTKIMQKNAVKASSSPKEKAKAAPQDIIVTCNKDGYLKNIPVTSYRVSKELLLSQFKTTTEDLINIYSNQGRMFRIKVSQIKQCGSADKGSAIGSLVTLNPKEKILAVWPQQNDQYDYICFTTKNGVVKKTKISEYCGTVQNVKGIKAMSLKDNDEVISITLGTDLNSILIITNNGYCVRFASDDVNYQGKNAGGVKGINLRDNDYAVSSIICNEDDSFLVVGCAGNCKLVDSKEFVIQGRGGKGAKVSGEPIAGVVQVKNSSIVNLITSKGMMELKVSKVKKMHRQDYGDILCKQKVIDIIKK